MQALFNQFSQVFGVTLLHSLWQGLVVYALLRIILLCMPTASAANKCNLALLALAATVIWPLVTLLIEISNHPITAHISAVANPQLLPFVPAVYTANTAPALVADTWWVDYSRFMPYLVTLWLGGILINSSRLLLGWRNLYQIRQSVIDSPVLQSSIQKLSHILKIKQQVQVFVSQHIDVPCIIGYLKPMIILPVAIASQFSAEQIQSILIHEMAHIRRNDYLVNLLQQVIAILFFFNPFTHLINRIIYSEREHSCDDLVLQITGQPLIYAQTLLQLEETRRNDWQLALAATGKKHYLLNRIKRIMETKKQVNNIRHILAGVLLLLCSMGTIAWLNPEIKNGKVRVSPVNVSDFIFQTDDTTKAPKAKAKIKTSAKKPKPAGVYSDNPEISDEQMDKLSAAAEKYGKEVSAYYESDAFKKLTQDMEKKGKELEAYYNDPAIKKMEMEQEKLGHDFEKKWAETDETKQLKQKMEAQSKKIESYYNSPEFKQLNARLEKKYGIPADGKYDNRDENYKKYEDELEKNVPADVKNQTKELEKMGEQYTSPEFIAQRDQLTAMSDSLSKAFNAPLIKQQQDEMMKMSAQMQAYQNSPELKKAQQQLNDAVKQITAYTASAAFKQHIEKIQKNAMKEAEKAEKAEKPEKTEKPEKPEKPEAPEKTEKPENN